MREAALRRLRLAVRGVTNLTIGTTYMSKLIRIDMPIHGRTRRFTRLTEDRFLYSCPSCTGLVSNDQAYCVCGQDLRVVANLDTKEAR